MNWMPENFAIIGIGRTEYSDDKFREHLLEGIKQFSRRKDEQNGKWQNFSEHVSYLQMDAEDELAYKKIADCVKRLKERNGAIIPM